MAYRTSPLFYYAAGAASLALGSILYSTITSTKTKPRILPSPLSTHDAVSLSQTPYPPSDYLPGARDVPTPYGNIRVYEFGPTEATRRVLLIHGISTPSVALAGIASGLADKGCRVMLLDLFGRGWSDAPGDLPYDERLYISELFMALASSSLPWTVDGFSIIGYSMGAGIAASFTSWFPTLVEDLVLLAPAGLIRPKPRDWKTILAYAGILPDSMVASMIKNRLRTNPNVRTVARGQPTGLSNDGGSDPMSAEVANTSASAAVAFGRPVDAEAVLKWQMDNHVGFIVPAFYDSMLNSPVRGQHDRWKLIGMRLDAQRAAQKAGSSEQETVEMTARQGLRLGKVLMVLGKTDKAVFSDELEPDARAVLGDANLEVRWFAGGHEVRSTLPLLIHMRYCRVACHTSVDHISRNITKPRNDPFRELAVDV